jgi:TorA maturation chaperone TorD
MTQEAPAPQREEPARSPRGRIYAFLANVLTSPPTAETVRRVRQMADVFGIACPAAWPLRELEQEYTELFVVPGPRYVAPYESVYRDAWLVPCSQDGPWSARTSDGPRHLLVKGLLMGESTVAVRACYRQAGVVPTDELPDHIGNELRFMAHLWERSAEPHGNGNTFAQLRATFRDDHLLTWTGLLVARLRKSDRLGYFPIVLEIAERVLQDER